MNYTTAKKAELVEAHKNIALQTTKLEKEVQAVKLNLDITTVQNKTLTALNNALLDKLNKILKLIQETLKDENLSGKITWYWVLLNLRTVIKLIKSIIDIAKN